MGKLELWNFLGGFTTKAAIKKIDGDYRLIGKFCEISVVDGNIDLWIKGRDKELSQRKVNNIIRAMGCEFTVLNGEAWAQGQPKAMLPAIQRCRLALGIAKYRKHAARLKNRPFQRLYST